MSQKVGLCAYRFEIKARHDRRGYWQFARNTETDGYAELHGYFKSRHKQLKRLGEPNDSGEYTDQRALLLAKLVVNEDKQMFAGMFLKGEAGVVRTIRNFDDPEADPVYKTKVNEGVLTPLYFRIHVEDGRRFGVLLLQTLGIEGFKGYIQTDMQRYFREEAPEARAVRLRQLVDAKVLRAFADQGQLQDVVLINSGKSHDSRQAMQTYTVGGDELGDSGDKLSLRVHRREGWTAKALETLHKAVNVKDKVKRKEKLQEEIDLPGSDHVDDIKVEIMHNGQKQTFSLLNPDDSPIRQVVKNPTIGPDGLPTWKSMHEAADEVWASIRNILK